MERPSFSTPSSIMFTTHAPLSFSICIRRRPTASQPDFHIYPASLFVTGNNKNPAKNPSQSLHCNEVYSTEVKSPSPSHMVSVAEAVVCLLGLRSEGPQVIQTHDLHTPSPSPPVEDLPRPLTISLEIKTIETCKIVRGRPHFLWINFPRKHID